MFVPPSNGNVFLNQQQMTLFLSLLLLLFFCCGAFLQSETTLQQKLQYSKNDLSLVYVWINSSTTNNSSSSAMKGIFFPKVDEFSRLEIRNSKMTLVFIQSSDQTNVNWYKNICRQVFHFLETVQLKLNSGYNLDPAMWHQVSNDTIEENMLLDHSLPWFN